MNLPRSCPFFAAVSLAGVLAVLVTAAPAPRPTQAEIDQWINQLGDSAFVVREKATHKLWEAGDYAEAALKKAAKSDDPEVSRRAREVLDKFQWGLYPNTPKEVADLITAYQNPDPSPDKGPPARQKADVIRKLLHAGPYGVKAVRRLSLVEPASEVREAVFADLRKELPVFLTDGKYDTVEVLLEAGALSKSMGPGDLAAFWYLRGKPESTIERWQMLASDGDQRRASEVLAYLYRARGDLAAARKAADKAHHRQLLESLLYEAADWKALAAKPSLDNAEGDMEKAAFRAAYNRLAGNDKEMQAALDEVRKLAEAAAGSEETLFLAAKAFLLNDKPQEGLEWLGQSNHGPERFEVLVTQYRYPEAMALVDAAKTTGSRDLQALELLQARTLHQLGDKDKAQAIFKRYADQIKEGHNDDEVVHLLLETEHRLGLKDQAFEHCARALELHGADPMKGSIRSLLAKVFPDKVDAAIVWWTVLRRKYAAEKFPESLSRLRKLLEGKLAVKEVEELLEESEKGADGLGEAMRANAQVAVARAAGHPELAERYLEKASQPEAITVLGDLYAAKGRWEQAVKAYRRAWGLNKEQPLPLLLAGIALQRSGKEEEGKQLIELAHTIPLGDAEARSALLQELSRRELSEAAHREAELLRVVAMPDSLYFGTALRRLALDAILKKDYAAAVRFYEQSMLRCLSRSTVFVQPGAYVGVPGMIHRLKAEAHLAAGELGAAKKEITLAQTVLPGNIDLAIQLLPGLEKRGLAKEADALFREVLAVHEKLCKTYPKCAWMHNSVAWMSACCHRELDGALAHAKQAVELAPEAPAYLDTLAEVHFQRGEKDEAVKLQKRVIELDPKRPYYRKQLKRIEAGDPKVERPQEDDD
jgi:tetratricopeptide (TPR) repeat protein